MHGKCQFSHGPWCAATVALVVIELRAPVLGLDLTGSIQIRKLSTGTYRKMWRISPEDKPNHPEVTYIAASSQTVCSSLHYSPLENIDTFA